MPHSYESKYRTHCKCGVKLLVPTWARCYDCTIKREKERQKKYREKNKAYQKGYHATYRSNYQGEKKKYYDVDKNNIKYYITDEIDGSIIGYKLIDTNTIIGWK